MENMFFLISDYKNNQYINYTYIPNYMLNFNIDTETQRTIFERYFANDIAFLKKDYAESWHSSKLALSSFYTLEISPNKEKYEFLPQAEFKVGTCYTVDIPKNFMPGKGIYHTKDGIHLRLKTEDKQVIGVIFPKLEDLFYLRNLAAEDNLSFIPKIIEGADLISLDEIHIDAEFYLRALSNNYGRLDAKMEIDHTDAEALIKEYLETIDRHFNDYSILESNFLDKDDKSLRLKNIYKKIKYNKNVKKLDEALFNDLISILDNGNLEHKLELKK